MNFQGALNLAEDVLPIFEAVYPRDRRPREAIDAAHTSMQHSDYWSLRSKSDGADEAALQAYRDGNHSAEHAAYAAKWAARLVARANVGDAAAAVLGAQYYDAVVHCAGEALRLDQATER